MKGLALPHAQTHSQSSKKGFSCFCSRLSPKRSRWVVLTLSWVPVVHGARLPSF